MSVCPNCLNDKQNEKGANAILYPGTSQERISCRFCGREWKK